MLKKCLLLFILLLSGLITRASTNNDSILRVLDKVIENKIEFETEFQRQIDSINHLIANEKENEKLFNLYLDLFFRYKKYDIPKAFNATSKRIQVAKKLNRNDYLLVAKLNHAEVLGLAGRYKEAFDILSSIDYSEIEQHLRVYVFHIYHSIFLRLYEISFIDDLKNNYKIQIANYRDSLLYYNQPGTHAYDVLTANKLIDNNKYDEALDILNRLFVENTNNNYVSGAIPYLIADVYLQKNDTINGMYYLAISATNDIQNSVKSYKSLQRLAIQLYNIGEIDRAYRYIQCAIDDATKSGSSFRIMEISNIIPIINNAYIKNEKIKKNKLERLLLIVVVLLIITLASLLLIYIQKRWITKTKDELQQLNKSLNELNKKLDTSNEKLLESNRVKEEYLGAMFYICSGYIDKIQFYTNTIQKSLNENRLDKISKTIISMQEYVELKYFYESFDSIFLKLYPSFISDINQYFKPEEKIIPKSNLTLTPEIRVIALQRLGIFDTAKIASLLHYSPQTVYNYKLKIHN